MRSEAHAGDDQATRRGPVLIVDDDPGLRFDYRELLTEAGYQVVEAGDGRKALRSLETPADTLPSLILLDLSMPIMDGWDFLAAMRTCAHLRAIPVVLVSAYEPDLDATRQGTVAAYLKKPFGPDELVQVVMSLAPPHLPGRKGSAVGSG